VTRKSTIEGLKNALWALGFAVGIWFLVDQNIRQTKDDIQVRLEVEPPRGLTVTYLDSKENAAPLAVIAVSAPKNVLEKRTDWRITATARLKPESAPLGKEIELPVGAFDFDLPPEVELLKGSIRPQTIRIMLAELMKAEVGVDLDYANVPEGWEVEEYAVIPPAVLASGPKQRMEAIQTLSTERIDVAKQLKYRHWEPNWRRRVALDLPARLVSPAPGVTADTVVEVRMTVRPKLAEVQVEVEPQLVVPMPGLVVRDPSTGKDRAFKLEPRPGGGEKILLTLIGPDTVVNELKNPKILQERVRALAIVTPEERRELPKLVDHLVSLPLDVKLPEGVQLRAERELRYDVNVGAADSAPREPPPGDGR
jgi:hypothetical protein